MKMVTIYIDDQAYEVKPGDNILQACLSMGLDLPYFCWHPAMGSIGACRQCALVQYRDAEDTRGRIVMGCMTSVTEGARFSMQGDAAAQFRENIIESLMLNHPHDCPVCAEGGECHLQDMTVMVGHRNRRYRGKKNTHNNQYLGPLVNHEMNRCIACYRCTRFYNDYAGGTDLSAQASRDHVYFGRHEDGVLESEFAGNLVEVCPTGVFTDKPLVNEYTRKWDLQSAPSVCVGCALGCNIMPGERYGKLKRIHNRYNSEVNGYFLCDRGRYGGSFVNDETRPKYAGLRNSDGRYDAIDHHQAMQQLTDFCSGHNSADNKVAAIGSPRASVESNYILRRLVGAANYCGGMSNHDESLVNQVIDNLQNGSVVTPSLKQIETADAVLVLGEDVTNTAPRLALSLRQSVRNKSLELAKELNIPDWQDDAVRVLAQDQLSPLFVIAVSSTPLDDVAEQTLTLAPTDIARFGFAVAAQLDTKLSKITGFDKQTQKHINRVVEALKQAKRPLIVSGTGCQNAAVIQAAAQIANALNESSMLSYCLPECNTMGCGLLGYDLQDKDEQVSLEQLCQRAKKGEIDTLLILENDLYRRAPQKQIDMLLDSIKNVVVLDSVDTPTLSQASLALPATTFAESNGTMVSSEGRAQRHYPVFQASDQRQSSYQWLVELGQKLGKTGFDEIQRFEELTTACAKDIPALAKITDASPASDFRDHGMKVPRQTHRYSGRTAMRADISVHEPKQPEDVNSPLSYSMEGSSGSQPSSLLPFVWSPGWNSNQSVHKFQGEVGGALNGGPAGVRIIEPVIGKAPAAEKKPLAKHSLNGKADVPSAFKLKKGVWQLLPIYRIFGSEELSTRAPAINELISRPFIQLSIEDAALLKVKSGDTVAAEITDSNIELVVEINPAIPAGCAGYSVGLPAAKWIAPEMSAKLKKVNQAKKSGGSDV